MRKKREEAKEKEAEKAKDNSNDDDEENIQLSEAKSQNNKKNNNNKNIYMNEDAINSDYSTGTENGDMEEKTRRTKWKNQLVTCILCSDSIDRTIYALYCPYHMEERIR